MFNNVNGKVSVSYRAGDLYPELYETRTKTGVLCVEPPFLLTVTLPSFVLSFVVNIAQPVLSSA